LSLEGRTAVVTGASRGIGAAIAAALTGRGVRVARLSRTASDGELAIKCDVTNEADISRAVAVINERFGGAPDILVNNAGLFTIRAIDDTSLSEFKSIISTNLTAPFALISSFLPRMKERGSGHVITIGSVADRHIFAGNGAYSAGKYGARALHEVLREETRGSGLRATLVSPSAVDTDIWDPIHFLGTDAKPDRSTMLDPQSVADAVLFALSQPQEVNVDELRLSRA